MCENPMKQTKCSLKTLHKHTDFSEYILMHWKYPNISHNQKKKPQPDNPQKEKSHWWKYLLVILHGGTPYKKIQLNLPGNITHVCMIVTKIT